MVIIGQDYAYMIQTGNQLNYTFHLNFTSLQNIHIYVCISETGVNNVAA